jgi:cation diffusion facilitator family transporter
MATDSKRLVILALIANGAIAITKFAAAAISGSSAMLAEGFHSVADTGNQLFVLRGHAASRFDPSVRHPFGRGQEMYFWSFMVAVFLFVGGSVLSIVSGIDKFRHPHEHGGGFWFSMGVLAVAAIFEIVIAFRPALKEFNRRRSGRRLLKTVQESRDPALLVVVFEDTAAVVGLFIAAVGLTLAEVTGDGRWDGLASIAIGVLLAITAWFLAVEMKALLIGEAASREERSMIRAATLSIEEVDHIERLLTMQMSPDEILVNMDVAFDDGLDTDQLEQAIARVEAAIADAVPSSRRVFIEPVAG